MASISREKSIEFALGIMVLYKKMQREKEWVLSKQLLRSATSIGANLSEAVYAQSTADFLSKISIALKEANETEYWLTLIERSKVVDIDCKTYYADCIELIRMLTATVKSIKAKRAMK